MFKKNIKLFTWFRILFTTRFYYPIYTILFLDIGLTLEEFALLNTFWAIVIVIAEVPSGALSDTIGHKKLLVSTSILMIIELCALIFCPIGRSSWLLPLMFLNRLCSGLAEAAASGADEALAYDSLKEMGQEDKWKDLLAKTSKLNSIVMFFAMIIGGILYDQKIMGNFTSSHDLIIKLPLIVNLLSALACFVVSINFYEKQKEHKYHLIRDSKKSFILILNTGKWILKSPILLTIIILSLSLDHIIRLFMTLANEYHRIIEIPISLMGFVGSGISILGFFTPTIAVKMVEKFSFKKNMFIIASVVMIALFMLSKAWPLYGLIPSLIIGGCMYMTGFFSSYYLNQYAPSDKRATLLSFKGLSFNLAYGLVGIFYAGYLSTFDKGLTKDALFVKGIEAFPFYFIFIFILSFILVNFIEGMKRIDQSEKP